MLSPRFRWQHLSFAGALAFLVSLGLLSPVAAQVAPTAEEERIAEDTAKQQAIIDRYFTVLEKNPRKSTALDKIYGFYVESGQLEVLAKRFTDRTATNDQDHVGWAILGLIEAERGRDAAAVAAFTKAVEHSKTSLPAFYLGQSLVLVGQPEKAVEAFELAIARIPLAADQLEVYRALGRVHQRAQRTKEALQVWERLEKLYPNDARVQEQIAATLVEEGQPTLALPRYELLVKMTKDDYRKSVFRMEVADLKVKANRGKEALTDLEGLLATLNPTSWLHREVRRKIDDVFLRTDDQDGLAKYYEGWVKSHPEDVDAMARLARILARQARVPEAQVWLDKALKLAPSRKELRLAFIDQLVEDQRFTDASKQYGELDKLDPNNPDYLRNWGKLILRDPSRTKEERLKEAEKIWRRLLVARPKDPLIATQVADLFRHNDLHEPALELYRKAVELAPDQAQYREYLGEFLHQLKRPTEAEATWKQIAEGKNRNATNLARLAEVYASFGYLPQAVPAMKAACELDPKDFSLHIKAAQLYSKAEKYPEALTSLSVAEKLAQNDEEADAVLAEQLQIFQVEDSLTRRTEALAAEVAKEATAKRWFLLARHYEASRQYPEAGQAIRSAIKLEPQSIRSLAAAARIDEQAGEMQTAADFNRKLAVVDRRGRGDYLKKVSQLETQLGRTNEALAAGRELILSAPGNSENYEYYAELCFRLNQAEEGLQALRRAMRVNPTEPKLLLALASALAGQFRTDEAVELYWQAFDKSEGIDERINVVQKLCDLYMQTNQLDRLLQRLDRLRRDAEDKREPTICLAQAYHSAGDLGMARQELESLLSENTRDTQLLQQLSKLAEAERDWTAAVKYQEQLVKLAPGAETEYRLATLLADNGSSQESAAIIVRLTRQEQDPEKVLRSIDSLLASNQAATALLVIEAKLREDPKNWELIYREGVALADKPAEAVKRFEAILAMPLTDTTPSFSEKIRLQKQAKTAAGAQQRSLANLSRLDYSYQVRQAVGLNTDYYGGGPTQRIWAPAYYWQARMAALGWLYRFASEDKQQQALLTRLEQAVTASPTNAQPLWDRLYLSTMSGEFDRIEAYDKMVDASRPLAKLGDPAGQMQFLTTMHYWRENGSRQQQATAKRSPLPAEDLELMVSSYEGLQKWQRQNAEIDLQMSYLVRGVAGELILAGRKEEGEKLLQHVLDTAKTPAQLAMALATRSELDSLETQLQLFDRWSTQTLQQAKPAAASMGDQAVQALSQMIGLAGGEKKHDQVLLVLDRYLKHNDAWVGKQRQLGGRKPSTGQMNQGYFWIWVGKQQMHINSTGPQPTRYTDQACLQVLRNAYEIFQRNDVLSDLDKHLRKRLTTASEVDRVNYHFALVAIYTWSNEPEKVNTELAAAGRLIPQDATIRQQVARALAQSQDYDAALEMLDGLVPLDQDTMRDRELLALEIAVRVSHHERARQAAERLFGLRLDTETQVQLAGQMRRLGMNTEADAVLARAQRQGGNRLAALVALMNSHQADAKGDVAAQIAYQILRQSRKSATAARSSSMRRGMTVDDTYRTAALRVLGSAGKLPQMIADVEQQLVRSPEAAHLYDTLAEYYEAAGDQKKSLELASKRMEQHVDDPVLRQQYAHRLLQAGKATEACDQFKILLAKQPRLLQERGDEVSQAFRQANRQPELLKLIQEMDFKQLGHSSNVINLAGNLLQSGGGKENKAAAIQVIKKLFEAFPENRSYLMSWLSNDELWSSPELFEVSKQSLLPPTGRSAFDAWASIGEINSYSGDGVVNTSFSRVVDNASKLKRLPELRADLVAACQTNPKWKAGPVLIALLDARDGKLAEARKTLDPLADEGAAMPPAAKWIVGLEIEKHKELQPLAVKLYEQAMEGGSMNQFGGEFEYSPGPRLIKMYLATNRRDEAHRLLKKSETMPSDSGYDPGYAAYRQLSRLNQLGGVYRQHGFKVDALRIYRQALSANSALPANSPYASSASHYQGQSQANLNAMMEELVASSDVGFVKEMLQPQAAAEQGSVLDLMLSAQVDAGGVPRLDSQLLTLLTNRKLSPEVRKVLQESLTDLKSKYPGELSVLAASAIVALRGSDAALATAAVAELQQAMDKTPLDELAAGERPNARQRAQAQRQVAFWPVAAECFKQKPHQAIGEKFAARALAAAQRGVDRNQALAILYARADQAFADKDLASAEKQLMEVLTIGLARPTTAQGKTAPITLTQFRQGISTARMAIDRDLPNVALQAIRESLRGGMPVSDSITPSANNRRIMLTNGETVDEAGKIADTVADELTRLSMLWRKKQFPADAMYVALHDIVLPADRKGFIAVYPRQLNNWADPESLGLELVRWSLACGKASELQGEIAAREAAAKDAAQAVRIFLAAEAKDKAAAAAELEKLKTGVALQPNTTTLQLWAHAAAVAMRQQDLEPQAVAILTSLSKLPEQTTRLPVSSLLPVLASYHLRNQQTAELQALCEAHLQSRQSQYSSYGGDYGLYLQQQDYSSMLTYIAQGGDARTTLDFFGRYLDLPNSSQSSREVRHDLPLWHLQWQLQALPAAERYELLKEWTFPTERRRKLRFAIGFSAGLQLPKDFLPPLVAQRGPAPDIGPLSNFTLLVSTAHEIGKLAELKALTDKFVAEKLAHAEALETLIAIAADDPSVPDRLRKLDVVLRKRIKDLARNAPRNEAVEAQRLQEVLIAIAATKHPTFRAVGVPLAELAMQDNRKGGATLRVAHLYRTLALASLAEATPLERAALQTPGLKHWAVGTSPTMTGSSYPPAWWAASGNQVSHITGFESDGLYFNYPLAGTFEFTFEGHTYDYSSPQIAFGGLLISPQYWSRTTLIGPVSHHETVTRNLPADGREWWNRYKVQVSPTEIRFFCNDHLAYVESDPSPTNPWLHLVSLNQRRTNFRNLKLTGSPEIPRSVPLVSGSRFDGWGTNFGVLPQRIVLREPKPATADQTPPPGARVNPRPQSDWAAEDGVLTGQFLPGSGEAKQSHLFYYRPLSAGETLRYEFLYEPGKTHIHPSMGRLAFLLQPAGVQLHWVQSTVSITDPLDLDPRNTVPATATEKPLPLVAGDWNSLEMTFVGEELRLSLNGQVILQRSLDPGVTRRPGLFYYSGQNAAKVRNVTLTGNWPEKLTAAQQSNLLELARPDETAALRRFREKLVREEELADEVNEIYTLAKSLPAEERWSLLRNWVLPSDSHHSFRLKTDATAVDQPWPTLAARDSLQGTRLHTGGDTIAPALELVRTAKELGKLDELEQLITAADDTVAESSRNRLALKVAIAVAREDDTAALAALKQLTAEHKTLSPYVPVADRHAEVVAVQAALARPALLVAARDLAKQLVENQQEATKGHTQGTEWERVVRALRGRADWLSDPITAQLPMGVNPTTTRQWVPVSHPTADTRGRGLPVPTWNVQKGKAEFFNGHGGDSIYFQSPLSGNFELQMRRTSRGWREIYPLYGSIGIDVISDGASIWRNVASLTREKTVLPTKIENFGPQVDFRLVVKDGNYTAFFNGQQVHTEQIVATADPWLVIQSYAPHYAGLVENVQILGNPKVPDVIDLSAGEDLRVWKYNYYGDAGNPEPGWAKTKDEITGVAHTNAKGANIQSVLRYHRPLLEDGTIEYDFFHESGVTEVHPAVDRAALLISPTGVKLHYLTDGPFNRTPLQSDNETELPGSSTKVPLKEKDWNRAKVQLVGDVVTVSINGEEVAKYTLEPTNQRHFGLFRYSDRGNSRIKNVSYRGEWPKEVPTVADQFLAK